MADTLDTQVPETVNANPFDQTTWAAEPTAAIPEADTVIVEEKKEEAAPGEIAKDIPLSTEADKKDTKAAEEKAARGTSEFSFANEESKKLFELLQAGKNDEVFSVLAEQKKLSEVDKLSPSDVIKLNLQYQNKEYSQSDITDLFNEKYEIPEFKEQGEFETNEDFADRKETHDKTTAKIEARIARDAKPAMADLKKLQSEIVLPDISVTQRNAEPTQEELAVQKANMDLFLQSVEREVDGFNGYDTDFKDEEVQLNVGYKLTAEEKAEIKSLIVLSNLDAQAFLNKIGFLDKDGKISAAKLAADLPLILNKEKILAAMVAESGNKRHEASVKGIKNIDYSGKSNGNGDMGKQPLEIQKAFATHFFQNS